MRTQIETGAFNPNDFILHSTVHYHDRVAFFTRPQRSIMLLEYLHVGLDVILHFCNFEKTKRLKWFW